MAGSGGLLISNLTKTVNGRVVLDRLGVQVPPASTLTVLETPQAVGAARALRDCLAGRLRPGPGTVRWQGKPWEQLRGDLFPVAEIAEGYPEFPNKPLRDALAHHLAKVGVPREQRYPRAERALEQVELPTRTRVRELDTAAQWRARLALALAREAPVWVVADVPGEAGQQWIDTVRPADTTVITFGLSPAEALATGDLVAVLHQGRMAQCGPPSQVYRRPCQVSVARVCGAVNVLAGTIRLCAAGEAIVTTALGEWRGSIVGEEAEYAPGALAEVLIRPEALQLDAYPPEENCLAGRVTKTRYEGLLAVDTFTPETACCIHFLITRLNPWSTEPTSGEPLYVWVAPEDVTVVLSTGVAAP